MFKAGRQAGGVHEHTGVQCLQGVAHLLRAHSSRFCCGPQLALRLDEHLFKRCVVAGRLFVSSCLCRLVVVRLTRLRCSTCGWVNAVGAVCCKLAREEGSRSPAG